MTGAALVPVAPADRYVAVPEALLAAYRRLFAAVERLDQLDRRIATRIVRAADLRRSAARRPAEPWRGEQERALADILDALDAIDAAQGRQRREAT